MPITSESDQSLEKPGKNCSKKGKMRNLNPFSIDRILAMDDMPESIDKEGVEEKGAMGSYAYGYKGTSLFFSDTPYLNYGDGYYSAPHVVKVPAQRARGTTCGQGVDGVPINPSNVQMHPALYGISVNGQPHAGLSPYSWMDPTRRLSKGSFRSLQPMPSEIFPQLQISGRRRLCRSLWLDSYSKDQLKKDH